MSPLRRYQKKSEAMVIAVQVDLDTDGFSYRKWGAIQLCKPGDWLVSNESLTTRLGTTSSSTPRTARTDTP